MPLTPAQAHTALLSTPEQFLRMNCLSLVVAAQTSNGVHPLYLDYPMFGIDVYRRKKYRTWKKAKTQVFQISSQTGYGAGSEHAFQAHWLKMSEWNNSVSLYNISILNLDNTGPALMFTARLSGCTIAVQQLGHQIALAHVRPNDILSGKQLGQQMGRMRKMNLWTSVFSANDYGNYEANIVGHRHSGSWSIYAQIVEGGMDVVKVKQIF